MIRKREPRNKKFGFSCNQSVFDKLNKVAFIRNTSINQLINEAISGYLENFGKEIEEYDRLYGEE